MIVGLPANRSAKLKVCLWIGLDVSTSSLDGAIGELCKDDRKDRLQRVPVVQQCRVLNTRVCFLYSPISQSHEQRQSSVPRASRHRRRCSMGPVVDPPHDESASQTRSEGDHTWTGSADVQEAVRPLASHRPSLALRPSRQALASGMDS